MSGKPWGTRGASRRTGGRTRLLAGRRLPATLLSAALAAGLVLAGISAPNVALANAGAAPASASSTPGTTPDTASGASGTTAPGSTAPEPGGSGTGTTDSAAPGTGSAEPGPDTATPDPAEPGTTNPVPDPAAAPAAATLEVAQRWVVNGLETSAASARSHGASAVPVLEPAPEAGQPDFGVQVPGAAGHSLKVGAQLTAGERCRVLSRTATHTTAPGTGPAEPLADGGNAVVLAAGANTVTTTFTLECDGTLTLAKKVVNDDGGTATPADWALSAAGSDGTAQLAAVRGGSGTATGRVRPGSYLLAEAGGPAGYGTSNLVCTVDGKPAAGTGPDNPTVEVGIGQDVVCTFSGNDAPPRLKLTQDVSGAPDSLARHWTLSATDTADGRVHASGDGGTGGFVEVRGGTELKLGRHRNSSFPEKFAAEFTDGATWRCVDVRIGATHAVSDAGTLRLRAGEQVECTIVSSFNGVAPTVAKSIESVRQRADGTWDVAYRLRVENPSNVLPVDYDLDDTFGFGRGVAALSAAASGPGARGSWNGGTDARVAAAQTLAPGSAAEYRIEVNASAAAAAFASGGATCTAGDGGFRATAVLHSGGHRVDQATACSEPVRPSFTQTALGLHKHVVDGQWDGTWNATYRITVANPADDGQSLSYGLANNAELPAGVELVQRSVDSAAEELPARWSAAWASGDGGSLLSGRALAAGAGEEFTVTLNVALTSGIASTDRNCAPAGGGLRAVATLSAGGTSSDSASCLGIPRAQLEVDTEATSAAENGDGTWTVGYTVAVRNAGDVPAAYDLAHKLRYANGFTALAGEWRLDGTDEAGRWDEPAGQPATILAAGRVLAPGASAGFTVTVTALADPHVVGKDAGSCGAGGAFTAAVELTADGTTQMDEACTEPYDNPRSYAVSMRSNPANGTDVAPGDVVTFTVVARNTGDFVYRGAVVTGETAGWQQYGEMVRGSLRTSAGNTTADGTRIVWTVGDLPAGRTASMTYQVKVHEEALDVVLENEVTATGIAGPVRTSHYAASMPRLAPVNLLPVPATPLADDGSGQELVIALVGGALLLAAGGSMLVGTRRRSW